MNLRFKTVAAAAFLIPAFGLGAPALAQPAAAVTAPAYAPITVAEVHAAQRAWGDALVAIARENERGGQAAAQRLAEQVLDTAYAYNMGPVLFKPTLTEAPQTFRTTREGALAYFVGNNPSFPRDTGFALRPWREVRFENAGIVISGNQATSMGNVYITDASGAVTMVDKTFGYVRDGHGNLRIVLHHSSLPYSAN